MRKLSAAAVALFGLMAGSARADSINGASIALNGNIGGNGGFHTVVVDGVTCKLKNSTRGPNEGCNYNLSGGVGEEGKGHITVSTPNGGCSTACE